MIDERCAIADFSVLTLANFSPSFVDNRTRNFRFEQQTGTRDKQVRLKQQFKRVHGSGKASVLACFLGFLDSKWLQMKKFQDVFLISSFG